MPIEYNCGCLHSVKVCNEIFNPSKIVCGCHDSAYLKVEPETLKRLGIYLNNHGGSFWALIKRSCLKDESGKITDQQTYITTFQIADTNN